MCSPDRFHRQCDGNKARVHVSPCYEITFVGLSSLLSRQFFPAEVTNQQRYIYIYIHHRYHHILSTVESLNPKSRCITMPRALRLLVGRGSRRRKRRTIAIYRTAGSLVLSPPPLPLPPPPRDQNARGEASDSFRMTNGFGGSRKCVARRRDVILNGRAAVFFPSFRQIGKLRRSVPSRTAVFFFFLFFQKKDREITPFFRDNGTDGYVRTLLPLSLMSI